MRACRSRVNRKDRGEMKMTKGTKIWLWFALVLGLATTGINASYGRWISVAISLAAMAGLAVLLFHKRKAGYVFMCGCYVLSFVSGVMQGVTGGTGLIVSVVMSLIGSMVIPGITWLVIRKKWEFLN